MMAPSVAITLHAVVDESTTPLTPSVPEEMMELLVALLPMKPERLPRMTAPSLSVTLALVDAMMEE